MPDPARAVVLRRIGWVLIGLWVVAFVGSLVWIGVPFDRQSLLLWIVTLLLAVSLGRRSVLSVLVDWLPFAAVLIVYDYARGASHLVSHFALWTPQITVEKTLFGGVEPTIWLQSHLTQASPPWWEAVVSLCYVSFFLMPYVLAAALWLRSRQDFRRWATRFVTMSFVGVAFFVFLPTAPPWAAAACSAAEVRGDPNEPRCLLAHPFVGRLDGGLLGPVTPHHAGAPPVFIRLTTRGFERVHLQFASGLIKEGQHVVDLVAAIPSLHGGCTLLMSLFLWRRTSWWLRPLLVAYPLVMAFSLIYSGEHYAVDVLAGWLLAVLVSVGFARVERRQRGTASATPEALAVAR